MVLEAGKKSDRFWVAMMLSLAAHGALLVLLTTLPLGAPTGIDGARLYSLTYLGSLPAGETNPAGASTVVAAARVKEPPAPPRQAVRKASPKPAPKVAVKTEPKVVGRPASPPKTAGKVLTSARGTEEMPLPAKPTPEQPPAAEPTPERPAAPAAKPPAEPGPEPAAAVREPAAGPSGSGDGQAEGAGNSAPPPRGVTMVARLPKLIFPKGAQNSGIKGTVLLKALVGVEGGRPKVEVERSSGDKGLDEYARRGVERGLLANAWTQPYVMRLEARFERAVPEIRIIDEPVEVGG